MIDNKIKKDEINFYTDKEICKRLRVSHMTTLKMRREGAIDFIQVGASIRYPQHVYDGIMKQKK